MGYVQKQDDFSKVETAPKDLQFEVEPSSKNSDQGNMNSNQPIEETDSLEQEEHPDRDISSYMLTRERK